jgi:hypothetical protein
VEKIFVEPIENTEKKFQFGNYFLWFPKGEKTHMAKFKKRWSLHLRYNITYPIMLTNRRSTQV